MTTTHPGKAHQTTGEQHEGARFRNGAATGAETVVFRRNDTAIHQAVGVEGGVARGGPREGHVKTKGAGDRTVVCTCCVGASAGADIRVGTNRSHVEERRSIAQVTHGDVAVSGKRRGNGGDDAVGNNGGLVLGQDAFLPVRKFGW